MTRGNCTCLPEPDGVNDCCPLHGEMVFAYADPPYPGQSKRLYGDHPDYAGEVDHRELVERLVGEYPDGWALSTGSKWLQELLALCPSDVRVLAWVKTGGAPPFSVRVQYTWEPVILWRGRPRDEDTPKDVRDSLVHPPHTLHRQHNVTGAKPPQFSRWLFACLGAQPGDRLDDLFPGSGGVGAAWTVWDTQMALAI